MTHKWCPAEPALVRPLRYPHPETDQQSHFPCVLRVVHGIPHVRHVPRPGDKRKEQHKKYPDRGRASYSFENMLDIRHGRRRLCCFTRLLSTAAGLARGGGSCVDQVHHQNPPHRAMLLGVQGRFSPLTSEELLVSNKDANGIVVASSVQASQGSLSTPPQQLSFFSVWAASFARSTPMNTSR